MKVAQSILCYIFSQALPAKNELVHSKYRNIITKKLHHNLNLIAKFSIGLFVDIHRDDMFQRISQPFERVCGRSLFLLFCALVTLSVFPNVEGFASTSLLRKLVRLDLRTKVAEANKYLTAQQCYVKLSMKLFGSPDSDTLYTRPRTKIKSRNSNSILVSTDFVQDLEADVAYVSKDQLPRKIRRVVLTAMLTAALLVSPTSFVPTESSSSNFVSENTNAWTKTINGNKEKTIQQRAATDEARQIQNRLIHYGVYCGPGPDDAFHGPAPVDAIDRVCQGHDQRYKLCLEDLDSSLSEHFVRAPKFIHQVMAIRGKLPKVVAKGLTALFPEYSSCIHHADAFFVDGLHNVVEADEVPVWWDEPRLAPAGAEGAQGYSEACVLGVTFPRHLPISGLGVGLRPLPGLLPRPAYADTDPTAREGTATTVSAEGGPDTDSSSSRTSSYASSSNNGNLMSAPATAAVKADTGICLVSSRSLFLGTALDVFQADLDVDDDDFET